ncbi:P-loop containing nucleoside triphosphate hydrolase protein [Mycena rebaudengoi]|nr:P-loop containing nucleoside triphosphate hydrolase protein [Mycena rebaudengoi]
MSPHPRPAPNRSKSGTPPRGTAHRIRAKPPRKILPVSSSKRTEEQWAAIREELKLLPELVKKHYTKWTDGPTDFQLECMESQVLGQDTVLHASTGAGKTGVAAGPHLLPSSKGKVTLVISPLLSLHEEQVLTFQDEFSLKAVAINSAHGGCTPEIMEVHPFTSPFRSGVNFRRQAVVAGENQIVLISPEMLLSRRFIDGVLRKPEFGSRCLSVFIDEAHCVSHWGASFRKKYASIGIIRAFLPRAIPIIAVSATLTPRVHQDLLAKLQIDPKDYVYVNIGNDRPTVAQVVRAMEHPMNSYRDLDFLAPDTMTSPADMPKAFIYCDDTKDGAGIVDHVNGRVHPQYRERGLVRPYNAAMSKDYRDTVMRLFRAGIIRVLVCTDAAGMGCDVPDVDIVVQWKAPANMSAWIQRAGRAARGRGREGLAVMLVEKTAFEVSSGADSNVGANVESQVEARGRGVARGGRSRGRGRGGRGRGRGGTKHTKDYAVLHGQKRGAYGGKSDAVTRQPEPLIPEDAPGEALYIYIQATTCRRAVQATIFQNKKPAEKCCDICNPSLFDRTRPSKPIPTPRQQTAKKGLPVDSVRQALYDWRRSCKKELYPRALFAPQALLDDDTCKRLSAIGPIHSQDQLRQHLVGWARWDALGTSLFKFMMTLDIPPVTARTRKRQVHPDTANKRARTVTETVRTTARRAPTQSTPSARSSVTVPPAQVYQNPYPYHYAPRTPIAGPSTPTSTPFPHHPPQTPSVSYTHLPRSAAPYSYGQYPPHLSPYVNPPVQYPLPISRTPASLIGNPYAALAAASPFGRAPVSFPPQRWGLPPEHIPDAPQNTLPSP